MRSLSRLGLILFGVLASAAYRPGAAVGKVDLVTLPDRDRVELTIYNSADLTLVRDQRELTLRTGSNRLQFSWANTLIDPTSLELSARADADRVTVQDLVFPPRTGGLGVWNVQADRAGATPMEISYFTSGIHWQAYYLATLAEDESHLNLEGYVRVNNHSGEDYEKAATRLVVGKIHLLDRIADLARREWPHGKPSPGVYERVEADSVPSPRALMRDAKMELMGAAAPKEIRKEALSEYFLYTIEGTESVGDGWGKRLVSFRAEAVPVRNLYRYEEERYGRNVIRFLSFANDTEHNLGGEPIPGGPVKVFYRRKNSSRLGYVGTQTTKYVPQGEQVKLNLGPVRDVIVAPTTLELRTDNYEWKEQLPSRHSRITGWDEHRTVHWEVANHRDGPVRVEVRRTFPVSSWEFTPDAEAGGYEKIDLDTVQFTLDLEAGERREFRIQTTLHHGTRGL